MAAVPSGPSLDSNPHYSQLVKKIMEISEQGRTPSREGVLINICWYFILLIPTEEYQVNSEDSSEALFEGCVR
jgi:hypothetical protein